MRRYKPIQSGRPNSLRGKRLQLNSWWFFLGPDSWTFFENVVRVCRFFMCPLYVGQGRDVRLRRRIPRSIPSTPEQTPEASPKHTSHTPMVKHPGPGTLNKYTPICLETFAFNFITIYVSTVQSTACVVTVRTSLRRLSARVQGGPVISILFSGSCSSAERLNSCLCFSQRAHWDYDTDFASVQSMSFAQCTVCLTLQSLQMLVGKVCPKQVLCVYPSR